MRPNKPYPAIPPYCDSETARARQRASKPGRRRGHGPQCRQPRYLKHQASNLRPEALRPLLAEGLPLSAQLSGTPTYVQYVSVCRHAGIGAGSRDYGYVAGGTAINLCWRSRVYAAACPVGFRSSAVLPNDVTFLSLLLVSPASSKSGRASTEGQYGERCGLRHL